MIITVVNRKGGVGKTTTVFALADALAGTKRKVLMLDVDPQASLTQSAGYKGTLNLSHVIGEKATEKLRDVIAPVGKHLSLGAGSEALAITEAGLFLQKYGRELELSKALEDVEADLVLIDTPPSLGMLSVNALACADAIIIPVKPQTPDLRGLRQLMDDVAKLKQAINPNLEIMGVLVTGLDKRLIHHRSALAALRQSGYPIFKTTIGKTIAISEAAENEQSIIEYSPDNPQAKSYRKLAREVEQWLKKNSK